MKAKLKNGFTLIELMVVIIIIGILISIALPNFVAARDRAKVAQVKANGKVLQTIVETYNVDYAQYPSKMIEITSHESYKVMKNPFTGFEGVADANGKGAWRTNNDGAVGETSVTTGYSDKNVSKGLVIYVGLNSDGEATTRFNAPGNQNASPPETLGYMIYGCDFDGNPIRQYVLSNDELPTQNAKDLFSGHY